jgi:hypothetical protein
MATLLTFASILVKHFLAFLFHPYMGRMSLYVTMRHYMSRKTGTILSATAAGLFDGESKFDHATLLEPDANRTHDLMQMHGERIRRSLLRG